MKAAESKTTTTAQHLQAKGGEQQPFFQQQGERQGAFFGNEPPAAKPFFTPFIQTKLTIGQPGDQYEQEADAMADKVVQQRGGSVDLKEGSIYNKTIQRQVRRGRRPTAASGALTIAEILELSRDPCLAHRRWRRLNNYFRDLIVLNMTNYYGATFASEFRRLANQGSFNCTIEATNTPNVSPQGFPRNLQEEGYRLYGMTNLRIEIWVHPSGRSILVIGNATGQQGAAHEDEESLPSRDEDDHEEENSPSLEENSPQRPRYRLLDEDLHLDLESLSIDPNSYLGNEI